MRLTDSEAKGSESVAALQRLQVEVAELRERKRAGIEPTATAKGAATAVTEQLKDQQSRIVEVIGKLEKSRQKIDAELTMRERSRASQQAGWSGRSANSKRCDPGCQPIRCYQGFCAEADQGLNGLRREG